MNKTNIILGAFICLGLLLLGLFIKGGIDNIANRDRQVTVRGLSERTVDANQVTWPIVTKELGNDLPTIYNRIQSTNTRIVQFLKDNGLSEDDFSVNAPKVEDLQAESYYDNTKKYRYLVTNVVVVNTDKVKLVNELIKKLPELMREGIAVIASNYQYATTYEYTSLNEIKPEMIAEATASARKAAARFAQDSDSKLGKIITASQGQFTITDRDDFTPDKKIVRVVTNITYELKN